MTPRIRSNSIKRVLVIANTRIGDAVLGSGVVKYLYDSFPSADFTIAAGSLAAPLFHDMPRLSRLIRVEKRPHDMHWVGLWAELCRTPWDFALDLRGSGITYLIPVRQRAIYSRKSRATCVRHKVEENAGVLGLHHSPPAPYIFTKQSTEAAADQLLKTISGPIFAFGPGASAVWKTWPAERFAELAQRLRTSDGKMSPGAFLLLGSQAERAAAQTICRNLPSGAAVDLTGKIDILTAFACLKRATVYVGNDSGLMHLAAAAGTPTVGLFARTDPRKYGPWGSSHRVVCAPETVEHATDAPSMEDIAVEDVVSAVSSVLRDHATIERPARAVAGG